MVALREQEFQGTNHSEKKALLFRAYITAEDRPLNNNAQTTLATLISEWFSIQTSMGPCHARELRGSAPFEIYPGGVPRRRPPLPTVLHYPPPSGSVGVTINNMTPTVILAIAMTCNGIVVGIADRRHADMPITISTTAIIYLNHAYPPAMVSLLRPSPPSYTRCGHSSLGRQDHPDFEGAKEPRRSHLRHSNPDQCRDGRVCMSMPWCQPAHSHTLQRVVIMPVFRHITDTTIRRITITHHHQDDHRDRGRRPCHACRYR